MRRGVLAEWVWEDGSRIGRHGGEVGMAEREFASREPGVGQHMNSNTQQSVR